MRISDWSSDVCSSDLGPPLRTRSEDDARSAGARPRSPARQGAGDRRYRCRRPRRRGDGGDPRISRRKGRWPPRYARAPRIGAALPPLPPLCRRLADAAAAGRSEERRVGKSVSVRVDLGGRRILKKKKTTKQKK